MTRFFSRCLFSLITAGFPMVVSFSAMAAQDPSAQTSPSSWGDPVSTVPIRDAVSLEAGYGYHTEMERISFSRSWGKRWFSDRPWALSGYWDAGVGHWTPHAASGGNHEINDYGITPVFRYAPTNPSGNCIPFLEGGIGAHYLSQHDIYEGHNMSTHFQFGDHIGAGVTLGPQHDWDVMVRFQHLSNAGLQNPNPGIDFLQLRVSHWF
ncbi:acyloxyacyl hydrolase [Ferrovum myxofaciens]|uniref:acyloxyacyl hydrolase n=1 Tax=Ferrovum myxofaciens TaxID=416213 RepID=UPI0009FCBBC8|nr:acyloxyacyl hydrolase [Ferrovum myxofaciens]NDU89100.1 acyloxyacyl hydrolase [Ferrovum sp.]